MGGGDKEGGKPKVSSSLNHGLPQYFFAPVERQRSSKISAFKAILTDRTCFLQCLDQRKFFGVNALSYKEIFLCNWPDRRKAPVAMFQIKNAAEDFISGVRLIEGRAAIRIDLR